MNTSSAGAVDLSSLDIRYTLNLTSGDLSSAFDSYLWSTPANTSRANVPVKVYSPGASSLTILEAAITYDRPPVYGSFPSTVAPEDTPLVTDLNTVFHDDYDDGNLSFAFYFASGNTTASVSLRGANLTITPFANASGDLVVNVTAFDSRGLSNWSGELTFSFVAINDPPRLTIAWLNVTWGGLQTIDLSPFIVDSDSPLSAVSISAVSETTVSRIGRNLTFDFSPGDADIPSLFVTLSDGSASATYSLHIHPRQSNTPPVLLPIATVVMPSGAAYWLDLRPYASDAEDALANLSFALSTPLTSDSPLLWDVVTNATSTYLKLIPRAPAGTALTVTLTVTDGDGNTNQTTVGIDIVAAANTPPRIVGVDPAIALEGGSYSIFLATKFADPEDNLNASRMNWSVENQNPELFRAEIDPLTQTLVLTPLEGVSGTGTLVLRVTDSGGAQASKTIQVTVRAAPSTSGASILGVALFFAGAVVAIAVNARRNRERGKPPSSKPKENQKRKARVARPPPVKKERAKKQGRTQAPGSEAKAAEGAFLRGITDSPPDAPPAEEGAVALGLKSGLEGPSAPLAAAAAAARVKPKKAEPRVTELYLFSVKDGGLLYQVPPVGVPHFSPPDENEFLQWAFDTVRKSEKFPDVARVFDWKGWKVLLARGEAFFIAGRLAGEDFDALKREVKTLVEEVDHNFPGTALDWQRTEVVETVADVLKRLVK